MLFRITNLGEARTVDFLGVFTEGETREFTQLDITNYQNMSGVPLASALEETQFDVEYIGDGEGN